MNEGSRTNSEALLHAVLDSSDVAIIIETIEGIVTGWSRGAERIFGYRAEEMMARSISTLAVRGQPADTPEILERARKGDRIEHYETVRRHKNGATLNISLTLCPIVGRDGRTDGFVKIARDITAAKNAQMSIEAGEAHLRAIIEAIPDGMVITDAYGIVRSFSPTAERMFGYTAREVCGQNVKMLMPSPDHERHDGYLARYRQTAERRIIGIGRSVTGRRKDGSVFPMDLAVGEVNSGGVRLFTGFIRDITERQRAEARIAELQSELLHVSRVTAMGQMATTLAHELNQPLTAAANYAQAARELLSSLSPPAPARVLEFLEKASGQAERAGDIIRRLRGFVEKRQAERSEENLNEVVGEASNLATIGARLEAVEVQYQLADALPLLRLDRTQIQQVVVNLVRNAVEVVRGSDRRIITICTSLVDPTTQEVAIVDTGPGIASEVADRLFQPFVSTKKDGMGIGLSICRSIIEAHGGRLWFEPNPGGGSVFRFSLPAGGR
jgi:two-component system, LuxR family, sensor kinase FixL